MTRIGIISDIHGDVHALRDALAQIERLGCDRIVCGGDLIDWGLFPGETIALIRERKIPCIRGNHDRWATGKGRADDPYADAGTEAYDASGFDLDSEALAFLAALPASWSATIESVRVALHHARPGSDMAGIYADLATEADVRGWLDQAGADVVVVGHTHVAFRLDVDGRGIVVNPGALLRDAAQPMDSAWLLDPSTRKFSKAPAPGGGSFGILELPSMAFRVYKAGDGTEVEIARKTFGHTDPKSEQSALGSGRHVKHTGIARRRVSQPRKRASSKSK